MLRRKPFNFKLSTLNFSGFTLLELLVVLAIMALLTAVSMPAISGYLKGARLRGGARQVASALRQARQLAITNRKNYMVVFAIIDTDAEKRYRAFKIYQVDDGTIEGWKYLPETIIINSESSVSTILSDTYEIPFPDDSDSAVADSVARAEFKPTGGATQPRTIRVESSVDSNQFREITYINTTGRVKVGE